ncbi:hypothetical protein CO151_14620 [bacterium CG_4_9_14_3_um_filter_65_15]|nr:MAG: hypothetical protein CO151_14620 [bacterium CG_4_9_14_3_um_filter_65_15]
MKKGMNIVNGLPEFLSEDGEFIQMAIECGVRIHDIRKPPARKDLHCFKGDIRDVGMPVITVLGTDCAVGKRTTAVNLVRRSGNRASAQHSLRRGKQVCSRVRSTVWQWTS